MVEFLQSSTGLTGGRLSVSRIGARAAHGEVAENKIGHGRPPSRPPSGELREPMILYGPQTRARWVAGQARHDKSEGVIRHPQSAGLCSRIARRIASAVIAASVKRMPTAS